MDVYPAQVAAVKAGKVHYTISQPAGSGLLERRGRHPRLNGEKVPRRSARPWCRDKENVDKYAEK